MNRKKIIIIRNIILVVIGVPLYFFGLISFLSVAKTSDKMEIYYEPIGMGSLVKVMMDSENNIYTRSDSRQVIQVYDLNGKFQYGVGVPVSGVFEAVMQDDELYFFLVREDMYYVMKHRKLIPIEKQDFPEKGKKFAYIYEKDNVKLVSKWHHKIAITDKATNEVRTISLQDTPFYLTPSGAWLVAASGMAMFGYPLYSPRLFAFLKKKFAKKEKQKVKEDDEKNETN